jgi:hypothetical protein
MLVTVGRGGIPSPIASPCPARSRLRSHRSAPALRSGRITPLFEITSPDQSFASLQVMACDANAVLHAVQHHGLQVADAIRDGEYAYSVRLTENGL